jgi:hypothetical protein
MGLIKSKQQQQAQVNFKYNDINNRNYFENLSNDLIYELFDYLSFHQISQSFGNLNNRFENLIDTYSHYVNLQEHNTINNQSLPRYINSLKISTHSQLSLIDLSNINSLYCLILSNLSTFDLLHIFNTLSLKELEYVYLGVCADYCGWEEWQIGEIQQKVLSLGELKLKKCVFRMKLFANIDQLPRNLPSLEYLRIDGCENILIVNNLLDRIPNLKSLRVSIVESSKTNDKNNQYIKQNGRNNCLTKLTVRIDGSISFEELIPLLDQNGLNIRKFIIYVDPTSENSSNRKTFTRFVNLYQRITIIINELLPQLTNFHLRVLSKNYNLSQYYSPPYVKKIPNSLQHRPYQVSIAASLATLWKNEA